MLRISLIFIAAFLATSCFAETAQFVRVELPGNGRILTLAEVEVIVDGKNVAPKGKATQSSLGSGGVPQRAMDGKKDAGYNSGGQTHTNTQSNPWWELDLGQALDIQRVDIWNRGDGLEGRLDAFTLKLLDGNRKEVVKQTKVKAPSEVVRLEFQKGKAKVSYLRRNMKKGKEYRGPSDAATTVALTDVPADYKDPMPFAFQQNDVVALVGNGLPDRFQHDAWFETVLQSEFPRRHGRQDAAQQRLHADGELSPVRQTERDLLLLRLQRVLGRR